MQQKITKRIKLSILAVCATISVVGFFYVFVKGLDSLKTQFVQSEKLQFYENLRTMYSNGDSTKWEGAHIDTSVVEDFAKELGLLKTTQSLDKLDSITREDILAQVREHLEIKPLPLSPPYPESNPFSEEKRALGEKLFNDPRLSKSEQIACASCHDKEFGFSDGRRVSYGHNRAQGRRNAPSIIMSAFGTHKFYDGRAKNLEMQVFFPIADPKEMAYSAQLAAKKLNTIKAYKDEFESVFGTREITQELMAQAIATYERSLMPIRNNFDRFLLGDSKALSDKEILGLHLFRTKARCINCHNGVALSDDRFHNLGHAWYGTKWQDFGRYEITGVISDVAKFKTPSLRGVGKSAPYMHNGRYPDFETVLHSYNAGMYHWEPKNEQERNDPLFPITDSLLIKLHLSDEELEALKAFLMTL